MTPAVAVREDVRVREPDAYTADVVWPVYARCADDVVRRVVIDSPPRGLWNGFYGLGTHAVVEVEGRRVNGEVYESRAGRWGFRAAHWCPNRTLVDPAWAKSKPRPYAGPGGSTWTR